MAALISKTYTFSNGATIYASEHNTNYDSVYNDYNGNITNANISASASIADTKLAQITTASKVSGTALTTLSSTPSGAGQLPSVNSGVPTGTILAWSTSSAPTGYLLCNGTAVSRTTYATLFALISTTYGAGDASTTFNVPNLKGRIPVGLDSSVTEFDTLAETGGATTVTLDTTMIPSHSHTISGRQNGGGGGSFANTEANSGSAGGTPSTNTTGGGASHSNLQPYLVINYVIKT